MDETKSITCKRCGDEKKPHYDLCYECLREWQQTFAELVQRQSLEQDIALAQFILTKPIRSDVLP